MDARATNSSVKRTVQVCWQVTRHQKTAWGRLFSLPPPLRLALICFMRVRRQNPHYPTLLDVNVYVMWLCASVLIREFIKAEGGCQFLKSAFSLSAGKKAFINSLQNVLKGI